MFSSLYTIIIGYNRTFFCYTLYIARLDAVVCLGYPTMMFYVHMCVLPNQSKRPCCSCCVFEYFVYYVMF